MKSPVIHQKLISLVLALVLCAVQVGAAQAAPAAVPNAPLTTIQQAIDAAADGDTVTIAAGTFIESLLVDKSLTLKGAGKTTTILQAPANQRVIKVMEGHNLRLDSLRVTGGHPTAPGDDAGGGVYLAGGSLALISTTIDNNQATYGGGVYQAGLTGSVGASNTDINLNTASQVGGGLYVEGAATIDYTTFSQNTAAWHGGGMHVQAGNAQLTGSTFAQNHATNGNGGGLNINNTVYIINTYFNSNTAGNSGGGLTQWNVGQTVSLSFASFNFNTAKVNGGGAYIKESFATVTNASFTANAIDSGAGNASGGGLFAGGGLTGSYLSFINNTVKCNTGFVSTGGGLHVDRPSTGASSVSHSNFTGNQGWSGSGIYSNNNVQLTVTDTKFINNGDSLKTGYGGGVEASWLQGDGLLFQNNHVLNDGGAIAVYTANLTNVRFIGNSASAGFGGAVKVGGSLTGANLLFDSNSANQGGAALDIDTATAVLRHATIGQPVRGSGDAIRVTAGSTLELKNSILTAYEYGIRLAGTLTEDYNLYFNEGFDFAVASGGVIHEGGHSVQSDPLFANLAGGDYHLRWRSPAIGLGASLGVTIDLDGRPRIGRFDAGAYQYNARTFLPIVRK